MMQEETQYLVPTGDGTNKIAIDLVEIVKAEQRLCDVAIVNQHTAPEMLSTFNDICPKANRPTETSIKTAPAIFIKSPSFFASVKYP